MSDSSSSSPSSSPPAGTLAPATTVTTTTAPDGTTTKEFKLIVISDINCPWCYIGQRALFSAIERVEALAREQAKELGLGDAPRLTFTVEHRPFCLKPDLTNDAPIDKAASMIARFGQERFEQFRAIIDERAAGEGVKFTFKGPMTQTTRAHRLLLHAWKTGGMQLQQRLLGALFKAYCEEERDVGNFDVLAGVAERVGVMRRGEALRFLASDDCAEEVADQIADVQRKGISGVPFVVIEGKWAVSGGQTQGVYFSILQKLAAAEGLVRPLPEGTS